MREGQALNHYVRVQKNTKHSLAILIGVMLITNSANVLGEVSYRTVRVDGLDIFYREAGPKDGPAILFLHGLPSSSRMYQPLCNAAGLEKDYYMRIRCASLVT